MADTFDEKLNADAQEGLDLASNRNDLKIRLATDKSFQKAEEVGTNPDAIDAARKRVENPLAAEKDLQETAEKGAPSNTGAILAMSLASIVPSLLGGLFEGTAGVISAAEGTLKGAETGLNMAGKMQDMQIQAAQEQRAVEKSQQQAPSALSKKIMVNFDNGRPVMQQKDGSYSDVAGNIIDPNKIGLLDVYQQQQKQKPASINKPISVTGGFLEFDDKAGKYVFKKTAGSKGEMTPLEKLKYDKLLNQSTEGEVSTNKKFADTYLDWRTKGGEGTAVSRLKAVKQGISGIKDTGLLYSKTPDSLKPSVFGETRKAQQNVIQGMVDTMRAIYGAAFTAQEGERLKALTFEESASPEVNRERAQRLATQLEAAVQAKNEAADYYQSHNKSLNGFIPTKPEVSMGDIFSSLETFTPSQNSTRTPEQEARRQALLAKKNKGNK